MQHHIKEKNTRPDAETLEQLEKDVLDLQQSMTILHDLVMEQQPEIDTIEKCISDTKQLACETKQELDEALSYTSWTSYITYAAGAIVMYFLL
jgi:t-SNARE complex subunit (syntaxin)